MKHSFLNGRDCYALLRRPLPFLVAAFCVLALSGFQCNDDDVHVPNQAGTSDPGIDVGVSYGHPDYDDTWPGVGDPCQTFTGGIYKIKKIVIEVFVLDANGNEVLLYPATTLKDGVNFLSGNPNSPVGPGTKYKIPEKGAYKVRTRVYGYPCDELPNPSMCLDCCEGDPSAIPFWEEVSSWREFKKDNYARAYVSYPQFRYCI